MKRIVLTLVTILIGVSIFAQDFQGVATYKSKRKMDLKMDSTQLDSGMQELIMEKLKKQFEKTYVLRFNKTESIYKEDEKLDAPQPAGMQIMVMSTGGTGVLYKNTKEGRFANQNESFSKLFLIKDKLKKLDWKLESETKNIGEYTCYKATLKRKVEIRESIMTIKGTRKDSEEDEDKEPEMEEITITAWYTTQIPVNNGPGNYYGLPGLILEVNDGMETVICSKIVLNPKNKVAISEPKKGKEVTQEKYDAIMEKKMKEMEEQYHRPGKDGHRMEFRVGG